MRALRSQFIACLCTATITSPVLANGPTEPTAALLVSATTAVPISPIIGLVRQQLGTPSRRTVDEVDRAGLAAHYAAAGRTPIWVTDTGLAPQTPAVIAELRASADWGLTPSSFDTPDADTAATTPDALAAIEVRMGLAVLKYARHARGGRIDVAALGRSFDQKPPLLDPQSVISAIAASADAAAYLRSLHPQHPQFEKLRQALLSLRKPQVDAAETAATDVHVKLPAGPRLKLGQSHPHVVVLRQRLAFPDAEGASDRIDAPLQAALRAFQQSKGLDADGTLNPATRAALNSGVKPTRSIADQTQRLLVNMERWRWLPENLGSFHVWNNIPEYRMRVLKDGALVHSETIIVGKPSTPTPQFSADMKYVIFHPTWGVPDGIKVNEIAPALRRSSSNNSSSFWGGGSTEQPAVLRRYNLIVSQNGRQVDPNSVNWQTVDVRNFQFTQPASASNVLGVVKFRFPNKHDVYMHDTPDRGLFSRTEKAFSHGCMRVQNPRRLAEVLLAEDRGWSSAQVGSAISANATQEVTLAKQIPVHVSYFTAIVDDEGQLHTFADLYGHDNRVASALDGRPIKVIAQSDPAVRAEREVRRPVKPRPASSGGSFFDLFSGLAGN